MNDLETTVLTARLHQLADELTPVVDPRRQVADARARHHRKRRMRITVATLATATAAVVAGTAVVVDLQASSADGDVADRGAPTTSAAATTEPVAPATPSTAPSVEPAAIPAGWEARSFHGIAFAVPPGARMADDVQGSTFVWNGPLLSGGASSITIEIVGGRSAFPDDLTDVESVTVPGAEQAWASFDPTDGPTLVLEIGSVERYIHVEAFLPAGEDGLQVARLFRGSIAVGAPDGASPGPAGAPLSDGEHFAVVHDFDPATGEMSLEPVEWLGEGRSWSCVPEQPEPYGTVDDVTDYCFGARESVRTVPVATRRFVITGQPPHSVDAQEFKAEMDSLVDDPFDGPLMGWLTVRNGAIVEFEQTPRQGA